MPEPFHDSRRNHQLGCRRQDCRSGSASSLGVIGFRQFAVFRIRCSGRFCRKTAPSSTAAWVRIYIWRKWPHDSKLTGNNLDTAPDKFAGKVCLRWLFIGRSLQAERSEREQAVSSNHAACQIAWCNLESIPRKACNAA